MILNIVAVACALLADSATAQLNPSDAVLFSFSPTGQIQLVPVMGVQPAPASALTSGMVGVSKSGTDARPCMLSIGGLRMSGEQWIDSRWKYECNNGTVKILGCIGSPRANYAEIAINETLEVNGFWHKCEHTGSTIKYTQEPSCIVGGKELRLNDTFRNGHFTMRCNDWGYDIIGCVYYDDEGKEQTLPVDETVVVGMVEHKCAKVDDKGRVKYSFRATACNVDGVIRQENETWVNGHMKLRCNANGAWGPIGCILDDGTELTVGANLVTNNTVHRCYRIGATVYYHAYPCGLRGVPCAVTTAAPPPQAEVEQNEVLGDGNEGTGAKSGNIAVIVPPGSFFSPVIVNDPSNTNAFKIVASMPPVIIGSRYTGHTERVIYRCFHTVNFGLPGVGARVKRRAQC